jgi:hypothetical protein
MNTGQIGIWAQDMLNSLQRIAFALEEQNVLVADRLEQEHEDDEEEDE